MAAPQFFKIAPKGVNNDMVLSVYGRHNRAKVMLWSSAETSLESQLFYEEPRTGTIRNKQSDYCLDVNRKGFIIAAPYSPDSVNQQWRIKGDIIQNGDDDSRVLDVSGYSGLVPGGQPEATHEINTALTQRWTFTS